MLREMTLEITQDCMNRCLFCSSVVGRGPIHPHMDTSAIFNVVAEAMDLGLQSISISGGEPFIHPDICDILHGIQGTGLKNIRIYTCGVVRAPSGAAVPLGERELAAANRASALVVFNIQSTNDSIHDKLAGFGGRLQITLASLARALSMGLKVECHVVPNLMNALHLVRTAHDLVDMGVSRVSFLRLVPQGNAKDNLEQLELGGDALRLAVDLMKDLAAEPGAGSKYRFGVPFAEITGLGGGCQAGLGKLAVRWDGACYPCEAFKELGDERFAVGFVGVDRVSDMMRCLRHNAHLLELRTRSLDGDSCPAQMLYGNVDAWPTLRSVR